MAKLKEKKQTYGTRGRTSQASTIADAKAAALQTLEKLPGDVTYDDIMYELYILQKIERGHEDIAGKKTLSHKEAKKRLHRWLK